MSYATADFSAIGRGFDRRAERENSQYRADKSYDASLYTANANAQASNYKTDEDNKRIREIEEANRKLKEDIANKDRESAEKIAKINAFSNVSGNAIRTIPDLWPLVFTKDGKGNGGNHTPNFGAGATVQQAVPDSQLFKKGSVLNPKSSFDVPEYTQLMNTRFRAGAGTVTSTVPPVQEQSVNEVSVWNKIKEGLRSDAFKQGITGALITGAGLAATMMKLAF